MNKVRFLVLIGQLGRIWSKNHLEKKVFQSLAGLGFFFLMFNSKKSKDFEDNDFNNGI